MEKDKEKKWQNTVDVTSKFVFSCYFDKQTNQYMVFNLNKEIKKYEYLSWMS